MVNSFCFFFCVCVCVCVCVCERERERERERSLNEISSEREVHVFRLFIFHMVSPILQQISMSF